MQFTMDAPNGQPAAEVLARLRDVGWDVTKEDGGLVVADPIGVEVRVRAG